MIIPDCDNNYYDDYNDDGNDADELTDGQAYLLNIPGWDWRRDDQAVCLNEVKYGLLAQVIILLFVCLFVCLFDRGQIWPPFSG